MLSFAHLSFRTWQGHSHAPRSLAVVMQLLGYNSAGAWQVRMPFVATVTHASG
jgi:hypothetical protein